MIKNLLLLLTYSENRLERVSRLHDRAKEQNISDDITSLAVWLDSLGYPLSKLGGDLLEKINDNS
jgi:hypothetical protein